VEGAQRVIPVARSRGRGASSAAATKALVAATVAFFVLTGFGNPNSALLQDLAQANVAVATGEWWRLFTPVLLHASITHILFNMWALWVLGPQIERGVGVGPFLGLYLAAAGVGGAFFFYAGSPFEVAVGASGAIFGLFGVWLNWALHRRNTLQGRMLLRQILFLLVINAALPIMIPSIAWQAHLGGLITGFVVGEAWSRLRGSGVQRLRTAIPLAVAVVAVVSVLI
jgi:membrane associated rhomboid family serine protease